MAALDPNTPVLIAAAQYCDRTSAPEAALSPLAMLERVARAAAADAGADQRLLAAIDTVAVVRTFFDSSPAFAVPWIAYANLPASLAGRIGGWPKRLLYPQVGGNTPQWLVNEAAEMIAKGDARAVLIAGAEAMRTIAGAQRTGTALDWRDDPPGPPAEEIGDARLGVSRHEMTHGIGLPVNTYPLFENALGHHYGRDPTAHRLACGRLFAAFTTVAAANPYAAFPMQRSAEELASPTAENRYIAYPYTKWLCAQMYVDQAAAVILTSVAAARDMGVAEGRWVFLHGCADTTEKWLVSERVNFHASPAIRTGAGHALAMAGKSVDDIEVFDLYSCFPSAVEVACDALGLAHDDPRGLTVTGGLPFFGGPGNNYTLHAIAEMVTRLRARPGAFGLVTGNGWFLTKHSFGVYGTTPPAQPFARTDPKSYQTEIDRLISPPFTETPAGGGRIETFTVVYQRQDPVFAIIVGRLDGNGARFLAAASEPAMLAEMIDRPVIGRAISVSASGGRNQAAFV